ncbi:MAG TPA: Rieske (2Fe-2S) protein [Alphaproteobacteria bacterium]
MSGKGCRSCPSGRLRRRLLLGLVSLPVLARSPRPAAASDTASVDLAELATPWSAVKFSLDVDGDEQPGIVLRLPDGGWYASSLVCPHAKCTILYMRDPAAASNTFDVDVKTPVLGCPCHFSVFDPARHGEVIKGPAPSPPLQLRVETQDNKVLIKR